MLVLQLSERRRHGRAWMRCGGGARARYCVFRLAVSLCVNFGPVAPCWLRLAVTCTIDVLCLDAEIIDPDLR